MLPHDPDLATPHHNRIDYDEDGLPVTDRRPVRAWVAVVAIIAAAAVVFGLWWFLVADEEDDADTTSGGLPVVASVLNG
jgi:hypothetical protein